MTCGAVGWAHAVIPRVDQWKMQGKRSSHGMNWKGKKRGRERERVGS